jgi:tetratricopeptide (TPR) repeat protein
VPLPSGTQILGRFEIVAALGAGSMGEVYQAHDLKLRRDVALKLLSPTLASSEEHLLRFEREAHALSGLNHPHICTIYDVGQAPEAENRPYIVMELLRGLTLFEVLAAGPLAVQTVVGMGVQIADALGAAHGAGIIHRDVKPANIFVMARGDAKLLDFGLAAMAQAAETTGSVSGAKGEHPGILTNPGTAVGTVLYMSPEQALGDPLDFRTDIFSLGLMLYEMLTGRRAFEGRSTTAIVDAILHATPVGLDTADISNVPRDLRRLLTRMLDKDKERRPASAGEVAAHLRAVQSGSIAGREFAAAADSTARAGLSSGLSIGSDIFRKAPGYTPAEAPSSVLTSALSAGNLRDAATIAIVLVLMALGVYGAFGWYRTRTPSLAPREPLLLADFLNTTGEAVFDGALKDALEIQLQQSPFLNVVPASQVRTTLQRTTRSPDEAVTAAVARDLCARMGVKAILLGSIAPLGPAYVITLEAQACQSGDTLAREQTQAAAKTAVLASVSAASARVREKLGESIGSIQRFNVPAQNATTSSLDALKAYSMGVDTRVKTGDVQAIPLFEHALEIDPDFALAAARLAAIFTNLRELEQAQTYIKQAFAHSESLSEPERLFIRAHYNFIVSGRLDEVVATYRLWIGTYPDDWVPHNNLSAAYERLGEFDNAVEEARAARRLAPNSVVPYQQLARALLQTEHQAEAGAVLRDAATSRLDSSVIHALAFDMAFLGNDAGGMQDHLRAAASRADNYLVLTEAARAAFSSGEIDTGRTLYAQAVTAARAARVNDFAGSLIAEQALGDALIGASLRTRGELQQALAISTGVETTWTASLAAAFSGNAAQAAQLAEAYQRAEPPAPDIVGAFTPMLQAAVALANNDGRLALDILNGATPFEVTAGPWLPYLRGLAYSKIQDRQHAAVQFRDVVARRGNQPTNLLHAIARIPLARSLAAAGAVAEARQTYADFAADWRNADSGQPLLLTSAAEAAALPSASTSDPVRR